jgi:carboxylesterase
MRDSQAGNSVASLFLPGGPHAALILHGLAGSPLEVRLMGRLLHRAGFSVSMPTIAGYSAGTAGTSWREWLSKAEQIHGELRSRYKTVSVAGLSVGATLALALAMSAGKSDALALWGVTLDYDGWAIPWYRWLFKPCYLLGVGRKYSYREKEPFGLKNERWRARVAEALRTQELSSIGAARIPAGFLYQSMLLARFAERNLARVAADTLVMHAADDETASPRNAETVYRGIRSGHKRKILLGDSYHIITMDNERDLVARETIRFFQQSIMRKDPQEKLHLVSSARALLRLQRQRAARPIPA